MATKMVSKMAPTSSQRLTIASEVTIKRRLPQKANLEESTSANVHPRWRLPFSRERGYIHPDGKDRVGVRADIDGQCEFDIVGVGVVQAGGVDGINDRVDFRERHVDREPGHLGTKKSRANQLKYSNFINFTFKSQHECYEDQNVVSCHEA